MELRVLGKVYAAGSKAPLALQCGKGAGKSDYFKVPPLHHAHLVEGGREGKLAVFCSLSWARLEALMWEEEESSQLKGLHLKAWVGLGFPLWR